MDFESIRPILSGLTGGLIATWMSVTLSRWVSTTCEFKRADILIRENKTAILISNTLFLFGLVGGVALYHFDYFVETDWRGIGLGFGFATTTPLIALPIFAVISGHKPKEAYVAFAISQKCPTVLLYIIMVLGVMCLFMSLSSLGT